MALRLQQRMAAILSQALTCAQRPRVVCLSHLTPPTAAGGFIPELIEMAGGKALRPFGPYGGSVWPWPEVRAADPDMVVLVHAGWSRSQARLALQAWREREEWHALRAVRAGEVALCEASPRFSRFGPRVVEALEILAEIVHPAEFQFGHEGHAWEAL